MAPSVSIVFNAGSSSLKFQVFDADVRIGKPLFRGLFEGLSGDAAGTPARVRIRDGAGLTVHDHAWAVTPGEGHAQALDRLLDWVRATLRGRRLAGIGHRVVHGGRDHAAPALVDDALLDALEKLVPLAPLHQPHNLGPIRIIRRLLPDLPQVACFDTAFHRTQPELAQMFALPRAITAQGVLRYGFHGLSYEFVAGSLASFDPALAEGRVVVAHLGNGASACALKAGRSVASTMGFSALDGLMMGTRCGAIDPAVVFHLIRENGLSPAEAEALLYTQCGLLGVSGLSNDMRVLRAAAPENPDARRAIDLFVYRIVREIGSLVAALGGIDGLVFTAGIGENDAATRAEVVAGLAYLGIELDPDANAAGGARISRAGGPSAWVIPTDEERAIARHMSAVLAAATD
ncbi:MAG: acetate/propionate family kinase [Burkholderiales bacterium]|nr:acetate/propionate family kinase [Burkholderiales bacterium]